ncbi:serine hydrolase [Actinokineospora soli]
MDELRAWLDERAEQHLFSGVVLVHRGGEPVFSHAAGLAHRGHGVPVRADTRFAVASVTKLVTATAALQLVERGALGLHAPLVDVLPAEHRPVALTREHTLHHLLSHTSGLTNYHDDDDETGASFIACWDRIPTYHVRKPADMLPLFADLPAHSPPGARFSYGDANYILIGLVIEAVTGRSYHDVVAAEVLAPAGMADAGFDALDTDPVRLATGYQVADGPYETWLSNVFSITATGMPDGGMICAAPDLVRLIDALRGGKLIGQDAFAAMTTPHGEVEPGFWYGYGMQLGVDDGAVTVIGHNGGDPGVGAVAAHHLDADTTVVVLSNQDRGSWPAYLRVLDALGLHDPR